jgi:hypothetical protein
MVECASILAPQPEEVIVKYGNIMLGKVGKKKGLVHFCARLNWDTQILPFLAIRILLFDPLLLTCIQLMYSKFSFLLNFL